MKVHTNQLLIVGTLYPRRTIDSVVQWGKRGGIKVHLKRKKQIWNVHI